MSDDVMNCEQCRCPLPFREARRRRDLVMGESIVLTAPGECAMRPDDSPRYESEYLCADCAEHKNI